MKLMCHGMEAMALAAVRINAKTEERAGERFVLIVGLCVVKKRRSASVFSLDSCVLCIYLLFSIHQFN